MLRKRNPGPADMPETKATLTVDARVTNDGGKIQPVAVEMLIVDPMVFRSPAELVQARVWTAAIQRGNPALFTPNVFERPDGRYSVLGWIAKS